MHENIELIYQYAWKVWRRRWIAFGIAASVCAVGWAIVMKMPDKYESMARVFLDTQSMLRPVLKGLAVDADMRKQIALTSQQTLLSRPNLEQVARDTDLDLNVHTPEERERLVAILAEEIEVTGSARDNIYIIKYQNKDPELARRVVDSLLTIFMESTLGATRKDTKLTENFLDEQIQEYKIKLEKAEEELKEFKRANVGLMPTEAGGYFTKIQKAIDDLDQAKLLLSEAVQRREALKSQLSDVSSIVQASTDATLSLLEEQILDLERQRDALMLQFTDKHPDVIAIKQKIEILREQQKAALMNPEQNSHVGVENPIYQELKIELGKVEAEVGALRARKRELERKVSSLRKLVDTVPQVEAELLKLNRDYQINKENYEKLVSRREAAKISRDASQSVDDIQFKIIDPPVVPLVPVGPNRPLLLSLVLLVGLGGGIAFTLFLSQVRATFDSTTELSNVTGLPVYGSVSMVWDDEQISKVKLSKVAFVLALLGLFVAYVAVVAVQLWL